MPKARAAKPGKDRAVWRRMQRVLGRWQCRYRGRGLAEDQGFFGLGLGLGFRLGLG